MCLKELSYTNPDHQAELSYSISVTTFSAIQGQASCEMKIIVLLSRRGATEHSSTRPRFSTHNLMIVFNVCIQIANKLGNPEKRKKCCSGYVM
jgi:hypothetical protein